MNVSCVVQALLRYARYLLLEYLLNIPAIDVNERDDYGETVAIILLRRGDKQKHYTGAEKCMKLLLHHPHFDVNLQNTLTHSTALMYACEYEKYFSIIKMLLRHKDIDVNVVDDGK